MPLRLIGLKKKLVQSSVYAQRVEMIEKNSKISILKQAELLSVSKSSHYYEHIYTESELRIMAEIDKIYTDQPYYGSRRISIALENLGYKV